MIFRMCNSYFCRQLEGIGAKVSTLLAAMQMQMTLYDEWLQVMADYATVFSSDRHKGDMTAATASEQSRGHNSSLVSILMTLISLL